MTKMKVIRDTEGKVINIGPWDYMEMALATDDLDKNGNTVMQTVITNPMPSGAREGTADIITGWDGGLYVAGDPRAERA